MAADRAAAKESGRSQGRAVPVRSDQSERARNEADVRRASPRVVTGATVVFGLAVTGLLSYGVSARFGTALLVAVASLIGGGLLGFLFGLPRSSRSGQEEGGRRLRVNTNLEEISDWLTKILVGVGLVQLGQLGDGAGRLIGAVAAAFGPTPAADAVAGGLLVFFTAFGFLVGYVVTRTDLHVIFEWITNDDLERMAEQAGRRGAKQEIQEQGIAGTAAARELVALVRHHLDLEQPPIASAELAAALERAPEAIQTEVYELVRNHHRLLTDPAVQERRAAVFEALTAVADSRYQYWVERGLALAIDPHAHDEAVGAINRAIQLAGDKPWKWYELYRAAIRAARWQDPRSAPPEVQQAIRQDLQVALANTAIRRFLGSAQDKPDNLLRFLEPYRDQA